MRILHLIHSLSPEGGGPAEGLRRIAEAAQALHAYEIEVVCLDDPKKSLANSEIFPVHAMGPGIGKYGYSRRIDTWLGENLKRFNGVVVDGLWQYHGYATWKACRGKMPYFVFAHGMLDPWFRRTYPLKHAKKALYWATVEHMVLRDAEAVLFTAELERELAMQSFSPQEWRGVVVPFGTLGPNGSREQQIESFYSLCPQVAARRFLLFLGRIHEKKGCDLLIEAFARFAQHDRETELVIAGPDQQGWSATLASMASRGGTASRVHFPGMLRGDAKWGAFHAAEAFVLPSHQENFGIAVAESLACGTPALISDKVNIWREIVEERVGMVEEDTVEGTFRLLDRWRRLSSIDREQMAARCHSCFERRFHIRETALALARLFSDCAPARPVVQR